MPASELGWFFQKLVRHWRWAREQGVRRLIEEDELNPMKRVTVAVRKWRWRRSHGAPRSAIPVFLVGVQRSGTNMLVRGLQESPEFEVYNENHGRAFERFRLRPLPVIRALVEQSRHHYVLFKPLADSHRTAQLLDELGAPSPGRAIWAYRSVDGRVRSALAKFGDNNLAVLREISAGRDEGLWQAEGLSVQSRTLLDTFDYDTLSAESAAALFWYVRNLLYFDLGLDRRGDVIAVSYDSLVADPARTMRTVCSYLGFPFSPRLIAHVSRRGSPRRGPLEIDPEIRRLCDGLQRRLDASAKAKPGLATAAGSTTAG